MEMMWGIKNPMHSLVPQELKVLTKEECLPMSKGMEMVLNRHKFDVKPEMVSSIHILSCTCRAMFSVFLFLLCRAVLWSYLASTVQDGVL